MATIPELTLEEKRNIAVNTLRKAADMIENADYVRIDKVILQQSRGSREVGTNTCMNYLPDREWSFSIVVDGEIGNK